MKIIKEGNLELLKKYVRFECNHCGCVFEAEKGEYVIHSDQREGTWYSVKCPTCKNTITKCAY